MASAPRFPACSPRAAESYDRFMGRFSGPLAPLFCDFAAWRPASACSTSAAGRVRSSPSSSGAWRGECVGRRPGGAVRRGRAGAESRRRRPGGPAEQLPFGDDEFDASLAQLVVHFMRDPVGGLSEMRRVTRPDGVVAACVWDHAGGRGPLSPFWDAVHELDPDARGRVAARGCAQGHLTELFGEAGLRDVHESSLEVAVQHPTFEEWWEPFTFGVGPGRRVPRRPRRGAAGRGSRTLPAGARLRPAGHHRRAPGRRAAWPSPRPTRRAAPPRRRRRPRPRTRRARSSPRRAARR